jgi:serine/threonine protein kinase
MSLAQELEESEVATVALPPPRLVHKRQGALAKLHAREPLKPGKMLGNYRIVCCLARGGMASVWLAHHRSARGLGKVVALKTILPEFAAEPSFERMFLQEARLASLIHHPNVCETFELIEIEDLLALSMEWVDGASLSRMLNASATPLDARIAARIAAQAAAGLHAAHELCDEDGRAMNLVHRDVSPQNILLSRDGHVRLSDFGIAKAMSGMRELSSTVQVQGKMSYLSPEQAGNEPLDRRSDIFSLGTVLYLTALGSRPFTQPGEHAERGLARLLRGEYPHPLEISPSFPRGLATIIVRALEREPARRYQTAADMRQELELWLGRSGPMLGEQAVAQALQERCGLEIRRQQELIRSSLRCDVGVPEKSADVTFRSVAVAESGTFRAATSAASLEPAGSVEPPTAPNRPFSPLPAKRRWPRTALVLTVCASALAASLWFALVRGPGLEVNARERTSDSPATADGSTALPPSDTTLGSAAPTRSSGPAANREQPLPTVTVDALPTVTPTTPRPGAGPARSANKKGSGLGPVEREL